MLEARSYCDHRFRTAVGQVQETQGRDPCQGWGWGSLPGRWGGRSRGLTCGDFSYKRMEERRVVTPTLGEAYMGVPQAEPACSSEADLLHTHTQPREVVPVWTILKADIV